MSEVKKHYDEHLAVIYTWMAGGFEAAVERNRQLFRRLKFDRLLPGEAVDLGAGNGFQSIPLAELGFHTLAIDFCASLLGEMRERAGNLPIRTINDDILNFARHMFEPVSLIVCLGDTLTHLPTLTAVKNLLADIADRLQEDGIVYLSFRDYASSASTGMKNFILVKSDASKILTCLLEYEVEVVKVHDILHFKIDEGWQIKVSSYQKLRLDKNLVVDFLTQKRFSIVKNEFENGMIHIIARKGGLSI